MRNPGLRTLIGLLSGSLLSGCQILCVYDCYGDGAPAPPPPLGTTTITVIPSHLDGHVGAVVVDPDNEANVVDTAYGSARIGQERMIERYTSSAEEVQLKFGNVMAAIPRAPISFTVFFDTGTDSIGESSMGVLEKLRTEMKERAHSEITVIGHTDRVGTTENNDMLSERRAGRVREQLVEFGLPADLISVAARGEREPVVATADEVSEQRNRRVEVNIR